MTMQARLFNATCALIFLLGTSGCASSSSSPNLEQRLDAIMASVMLTEQPPGMVLGVWTPTETYLKAAGVADINTGEPMEVGMNYRIGSQTKMYISTVILQMVDEGTLGLDDTVAQHIDGVTGGEGITLFQLLTNTSGIKSYTQVAWWQTILYAHPTTIWTPWELVDVSNAETPLFAPGEGWDYCNTNFVILGLIAEKYDGKALELIFRDRLFTPLGTELVYLPAADDFALPAPSMRGYFESGVEGDPRLQDYTDHSSSWAWASGGLISNVADSKRWIEAAVDGGLLSETMQAKRMSTWINPATGAVGASSGYGMGIGDKNGTVGHTGSLPGWTSGSYRMVEEKTTIIFMFNFQSEVSNPDVRLLDEVAAAVRATN